MISKNRKSPNSRGLWRRRPENRPRKPSPKPRPEGSSPKPLPRPENKPKPWPRPESPRWPQKPENKPLPWPKPDRIPTWPKPGGVQPTRPEQKWPQERVELSPATPDTPSERVKDIVGGLLENFGF